ncbi:MAG: hypothetical protein DWP97_09345 [Calditrichaeota bacterium]|nr:MAG: hypothetical protein DWP97_09345 [Calditrichota bacterium]
MIKIFFNLLLSLFLLSTTIFADNPMLGCLLKGESYKCLIETKTVVETSSSCGGCYAQVSACEIVEEPEVITCDIHTNEVFKDQCICTIVRHIQIANLPNETKIFTYQNISQTLHRENVKETESCLPSYKDNYNLSRIHHSIASTVLRN